MRDRFAIPQSPVEDAIAVSLAFSKLEKAALVLSAGALLLAGVGLVAFALVAFGGTHDRMSIAMSLVFLSFGLFAFAAAFATHREVRWPIVAFCVANTLLTIVLLVALQPLSLAILQSLSFLAFGAIGSGVPVWLITRAMRRASPHGGKADA